MNALSVVPFLQERKSVLEKYFWDWGTSSKRHARSTGLPAGVFVLPEVFCCFLSVFAKAWLKVWSFVNTCSFKIHILLLWVSLRLYLPLLTISLHLVNDLVSLVYDFYFFSLYLVQRYSKASALAPLAKGYPKSVRFLTLCWQKRGARARLALQSSERACLVLAQKEPDPCKLLGNLILIR